MRINKVKLSNFAQHRNLDVDISENIVGIIGRNGSGKSNFAASISMAITGEFGKKKKKDLITFGQKTGSIYVEGNIKNKELQPNKYTHLWKTSKTKKSMNLVFRDDKLISLNQTPAEKEELRINVFNIKQNKSYSNSCSAKMLFYKVQLH